MEDREKAVCSRYSDFFSMGRRLIEFLAMLMVGDGLLSMIDPKRHCLLWDTGPKLWRDMANEFAAHPDVTRGIGLVELLAGVWLASVQRPKPEAEVKSKFSELVFHR